MDYDSKLDELQQRVDDAKASVNAAATENHEQLKKRIDKAQNDVDRAAAEAKQKAQMAEPQPSGGELRRRGPV